MNGREIIRTLVNNRYRRSFCLPNYTPRNWWECDVFELTKSGYFREYEVKVSRADFFADAGKTRETWLGPRRFGPTVLGKHSLLAVGNGSGPVAFYYVTPVGLLQPDELPPWAGLIELIENPPYQGIVTLREKETTPAPRLHREKVADGIGKHAMSVCYWRMHDLRTRKIA